MVLVNTILNAYKEDLLHLKKALSLLSEEEIYELGLCNYLSIGKLNVVYNDNDLFIYSRRCAGTKYNLLKNESIEDYDYSDLLAYGTNEFCIQSFKESVQPIIDYIM